MYDNHEENLRQIGDYTLKRTDPYGFWIILDAKGKLEKRFKNERFLTPRDAAIALKAYTKGK